MTSAGIDRVEAVLLDYGGTLAWFDVAAVDVDGAQQQVAARIAAAGVVAPSAAVLRESVHDRVEREVVAHDETGALEEIDIRALERRCFADLGLRLDDDLLDDCARIVQIAWFAGARLYDDVLPALEELRGRGIRTVVCSNAPYRAASLHAQLAHVGITGLLDGAVFSGEVGWRKPSPRMYDAALRIAGTAPSSAVMVGDRLREDVEGAVARGISAVLVDRSRDDVTDIVEPVPHIRVPALTALLDVTTSGDGIRRR